jgi:hypothetical protein
LYTGGPSKNRLFLEGPPVIPYRNYVFIGTILKTEVFRIDSYRHQTGEAI